MDASTDGLRIAYREETLAKTLQSGRLLAFIVSLVLPYLMIVQDLIILHIPEVWPLRVLAIAASGMFLLLSFTVLKRRPALIIPLHVVQLAALMLQVVGLVFWVFLVRPPLPQVHIGMEGALFINILATFMFAGGARRYLLLVHGLPLAMLLVALAIADVLRPEEWTILVDPCTAVVCVVIYSFFEERRSWREFSARRLAVNRKADLEAAVAELRRTNEQLGRQIEERGTLQHHLDEQAARLNVVNERLREEADQNREATQMLQRQAQRLGQSNQDLQRFAHVASHDLKEPLRVVAAFVGLIGKRLSARKELSTDLEEFIGFAVDGARRMEQLIDGLLSWSRVGMKKGTFEPIDLGDVVESVRGNLMVALGENRATLEAGRLPVVRGDGPQLVQLFQNLVSNALRYRKQHVSPVVKVTSEAVDGEVCIRVADNGIGIEPEYHDRIFEIFQRLHTQAEYEGTGIGLAICKRIVDRHGGRIWVTSSLGVGSTFHVALPRQAT